MLLGNRLMLDKDTSVTNSRMRMPISRAHACDMPSLRLVHNMTHCNALRRVASRCVASMRHIVNMLGYELFTRRTATHRNARLD